MIISNSVLETIEEYTNALTYYPISEERADAKVNNMLSSLYNLGKTLYAPPVCLFKDLGQDYDENNNIANPNLKRYDYSDESGFQWAFACLYNENKNRIIITKMMPANQVKEEKSNDKNPILEFMERLDLIK